MAIPNVEKVPVRCITCKHLMVNPDDPTLGPFHGRCTGLFAHLDEYDLSALYEHGFNNRVIKVEEPLNNFISKEPQIDRSSFTKDEYYRALMKKVHSVQLQMAKREIVCWELNPQWESVAGVTSDVDNS